MARVLIGGGRIHAADSLDQRYQPDVQKGALRTGRTVLSRRRRGRCRGAGQRFPFGLGDSVFTHDTERGKRIARRIKTGMVFINSSAVSSPEMPFGGVKNSGYGRELSGAGIQEFVNKKLIRVN
ncbi:MAG: aldehyde dehydrogenase [Variovorax sp.]|nr:aldehyde dehydrogenase [Variovorax sp.]